MSGQSWFRMWAEFATDPKIQMLSEEAHLLAEVWRKVRTRIFSRDGYTCQYCGKTGVRLECDHVFPVALGGGHEDQNLVTACITCNRAKGSKTILQWKAL